MSMQPDKVFNHGWTRTDTDTRPVLTVARRPQTCGHPPAPTHSIPSVSVRVHPWLIILAFMLQLLVTSAATPETATNVFESSATPTPEGQIDKLVFAELARLKIEPVLCSDAVFVRRAYLDVIGTLPTAKEAREFIQDPDTKSKRRLLIDRLTVEAYAFGGESFGAHYVHPKHGPGKYSLHAVGGEAKVHSLIVRKLKSAWR